MSKELLPQYNPKDVEDRIYQKWEKSGFFSPDNLPTKSKKTFSIVVPPPNITGSLHMGHALNAIIQDILIRKKRMEGYKTLWLPGTDHAGIAANSVVEKDLKKQGLSRFDLGREKFIEKVWEWKEKYGHIILDQFKKLGSSMDWSRTRFTMDKEYQNAVNHAFIRYYKKGWIYQGERTVNWCARCGTSLSDLELEYKEEQAKFYYIKYGPLTVGTVRPETKLGDTALAVNPKDERYKGLAGKEIIIQSVDSSIPRDQPPALKNITIMVVADKIADPEFGTGVIKVTPAHDHTDFEIFQRHPEIPIIRVIDERGRMTKTAGVRYEGLKVLEAREQIVKDLQELGLLKEIQDYTHNVAVCYRCGTVIEPLLSKQWFLKMEKLSQHAVKAVRSGKVKFHPKRWGKVYLDWQKDIHDWPISRQIWWGHQIPLWLHEPKCIPQKDHEGEIIKCKETVASGTMPVCEYCDAKYIQSTDTLDTWFSSALWPFATLGWPHACAQGQKSKVKSQKFCAPRPGTDLDNFYPTQVLSTARDIINLWVARMVFSGLELIGKEPFRDVIIHATILTKDGKRMSKSLGTGIDPMDLIEKYGADATRFGIMWQAMGTQDIHWSEEHVVAGKKFANKIWNASRFVLQQIAISKFKFLISKTPKTKTREDKKILAELAKAKKSVSKKIENYEFGAALHDLYEFFWHVFCDKYIESSKSQITDDKLQKTTQEILLYVLAESLKLLHPFMPFLTEEIWEHLPFEDKKFLIVESWPE